MKRHIQSEGTNKIEAHVRGDSSKVEVQNEDRSLVMQIL